MFYKEERLAAFEKLGRFMSQYQQERQDEDLQKLNKFFLEHYRTAIQEANLFNHWFSEDNLHFALQQWSEALTRENLEKWTAMYSDEHWQTNDPKTIAIIMAGNIPLVGFHDFLSVLMTGHKALAKPSSDDEKLLPVLVQVLVAIDKRFADRIVLADGRIKDFDAVIATGSDNSARYFEHYFGKYPNIIRKNRTSVAVIQGDETEEQLKKLGEDVFRYFGLGCRNVSKLYLPEGFNTDRIFEALFDFSDVANNKKYGNNFDYNRAIYLLEKIKFLENGFVILREHESLHAPVSVLHYERYQDAEKLNQQLEEKAEKLQCVVSENSAITNAIPMGSTQQPALWDYADKVDPIKFLHSLH